MPKEKKVQTPDDTTEESVLETIAKSLKAIEDGQTAILNALERPITSKTPEDSKPVEPAVVEEPKKDYPVPVDYRDVIEAELNRLFVIEVEPMSDAPLSKVTIVVPEKYNTLNASQKEMMKRDERVKVISYADGANGVREFAKAVYDNLGAEIQAQVVADRTHGS